MSNGTVNGPANCPECGLPHSGWLGDNCPGCLLRLAVPAPAGEGERDAAARSARAGILRALGDYELLEEIARGGMGVVYRARQVSLNRLVAVKVLLAAEFARDTHRFRREAEMAASLSHPNIVSVYEVGEHEGQPYFSMELIEGRSLAELVRDHPLPARHAAQLMKMIAEAVHFAHERRVLHRDLKPSNILVDAFDIPHVTDFGLAKRLDGDADLTLTGQVLGTPNYMPPEQAEANGGQSSVAGDVYSLGAILYQMLAGRAPFMAETLTQTLRLVAEIEPVSPRMLNPSVPRDLETICLKCLEKDAGRRYASARELADELNRFLRDEPIMARPLRAPAKVLRWCRRKPALAFSIATAAALLLLIVIGSPIAIIRINQERKLAEAAERRTEQQLYAALLEQARATVLTGELGHRIRALDAVRRAVAISNSAALRGVAVTALALPDLSFERELPLASDFALVKLDPAFERIALCRGNGPVEIRSVSNHQLVATLPASTNRPASVGLWSSDGQFLALCRDNDPAGRFKEVEVWEVARARRVLLLHDSPWGAMSFHPRLPRLMVGRAPATAVTWDLQTGQELQQQPLKGQPVNLKFAPDGESFAATRRSGEGTMVDIYAIGDGALRASHQFAGDVPEFDWHPSGRWIAAPDRSGTVHLMEAQTGETRVLGQHKGDAVLTVFSPDGRYLFSGGWDRQLICWDVKSMRRAFTVGLDSYRLQFRADGRQCAIVRWPDVRVQLHTFELPALHREFGEDLGGHRNDAAFSPDGRWLAASGAGDHAVVWDLTRDAPGTLLKSSPEARVSFAANGELFTSRLGGCSRWEVTPGTNGLGPVLQRLELARPAGFSSLCLVSNGVVFTGARGSKIIGFDQLASEQGPWNRTTDGWNGASPGGHWLAVYRPFSPHLYVHRLPGFERVAKLTNEARISQFEFSPLGDEVAVASRGGVEFWSTTTWQRTRHLTNFGGILYSAGANTLWLSTRLGTAGLHEARTAEPLLPLPPNTVPLALSPDSRHLAVSVDDRHVQVWDLAEVRRQLRALGLDWVESRPAVQTAGQ